MPEVHFEVRWPDGNQQTYYSPSTAIHAHLAAGESYALPDFLVRTRSAMHAASERVRARYGYTCSSALDTLHQIETTASGFAHTPAGRVQVLTMNTHTLCGGLYSHIRSVRLEPQTLLPESTGMRRSEFNDPEEFRKVKAMMLELSQPEAILYEQLATGDHFQVLKNVDEYRQSRWAGDSTRQPGPWIKLEP